MTSVSIGTVAEWNDFAEKINDGTYTADTDAVLTSNLNFLGETFTALGSSSVTYTGTLDGNGHTISNVGSSSARHEGQLIISSGTLQKIHFSNCYVHYERLLTAGTASLVMVTSCDISYTESSSSGRIIDAPTCTDILVQNCRIEVYGSTTSFSGSSTATFLYSGNTRRYANTVCINNTYIQNNGINWSTVTGFGGDYHTSSSPQISNCVWIGGSLSCGSPGAVYKIGTSNGSNITNCYAVDGGTSASSNNGLAITADIYEQENFWNDVGVEVGGITYKCGLDFTNTWYWDATEKMPKLRAFVVQISTISELMGFARRVNNGETSLDGLLTANIDATGVTWIPIGVSTQPYEGILDGDGYTISNLNEVFMYCGNSRVSRIKFSDCNLDFTSRSDTTSSFLFYANPTTECTFEELWIDGCTFKYYVPSGCYGGGATVFCAQGTTVNISDIMATDCTLDSTGYDNGCGGGGGVVLVNGYVTTLNMENCYLNDMYFGTPHGKRDTNISAVLYGMSFGIESAAHTHNISECIFRGGSTQGYVYATYSSVVSNLTKVYFDATTTRSHVTSSHTNVGMDGTEVAHDLTSQQEFYDGTGIAGTVYLEWDFTNTWEWDLETSSPILKVFAENSAPTVKIWNGSNWVDGTPHVWNGTEWKQADKVWVHNGTEWKEGV